MAMIGPAYAVLGSGTPAKAPLRRRKRGFRRLLYAINGLPVLAVPAFRALHEQVAQCLIKLVAVQQCNCTRDEH